MLVLSPDDDGVVLGNLDPQCITILLYTVMKVFVATHKAWHTKSSQFGLNWTCQQLLDCLPLINWILLNLVIVSKPKCETFTCLSGPGKPLCMSQYTGVLNLVFCGAMPALVQQSWRVFMIARAEDGSRPVVEKHGKPPRRFKITRSTSISFWCSR